MNKPIQQEHLFSGWDKPGIVPVYRGSFEDGERPPRRVRVAGLSWKGGASARFRAPSSLIGPSREFGTSVYLDPEQWKPTGQRRGWYTFKAASPGGTLLLGLWSSLPATWLAQKANGEALRPPWRELWTFGSDHTWAFRFSESSTSAPDVEAFLLSCLDSRPVGPSRWAGTWYDG